jgi:hypothetical protein
VAGGYRGRVGRSVRPALRLGCASCGVVFGDSMAAKSERAESGLILFVSDCLRMRTSQISLGAGGPIALGAAELARELR